MIPSEIGGLERLEHLDLCEYDWLRVGDDFSPERPNR